MLNPDTDAISLRSDTDDVCSSWLSTTYRDIRRGHMPGHVDANSIGDTCIAAVDQSHSTCHVSPNVVADDSRITLLIQ